MKILNFGSCNIDYVYSLDHIVSPGETEYTDQLDVFPGGKGLNQSIAASRAGARIYHAGCIGSNGQMLRELLIENKVDVSYLRTVTEKNGHAIIQVSNKGENSIFLYPGSNQMITTEDVDLVLNHFQSGDMILLQNEISNVAYIIQKAYEKKMQILFNPSPFREELRQIDFHQCSYLMLNEVEAKAISGYDDPSESLQYFKINYPQLHVILTLGQNGCFYTDGMREEYCPAFLTDTVDTTAAGDTFTGYFTAELQRNTEPAKALKIASAAAAIAVSRNGAAPSIPYRREVLEALQTLKENTAGRSPETIRSQIESYIRQHLNNASLQELSDCLGYSKNHTADLVNKYMGMPFSKIIQQKRCQAAAELLLRTNWTIETVAHHVGYRNVTFFRNVFLKKYGKNPSEFRKLRQ